METDKLFFQPGMRVRCSKVSNSPEMYVLHKKELVFKDREDKSKILQGMVCRWFTKDGFVQEATFNTKDIELIK
jgi:uncharacterized protein YodC (DUF2158 family)